MVPESFVDVSVMTVVVSPMRSAESLAWVGDQMLAIHEEADRLQKGLDGLSDDELKEMSAGQCRRGSTTSGGQ